MCLSSLHLFPALPYPPTDSLLIHSDSSVWFWLTHGPTMDCYCHCIHLKEAIFTFLGLAGWLCCPFAPCAKCGCPNVWWPMNQDVTHSNGLQVPTVLAQALAATAQLQCSRPEVWKRSGLKLEHKPLVIKHCSCTSSCSLPFPISFFSSSWHRLRWACTIPYIQWLTSFNILQITFVTSYRQILRYFSSPPLLGLSFAFEYFCDPNWHFWDSESLWISLISGHTLVNESLSPIATPSSVGVNQPVRVDFAIGKQCIITCH